MSNEEVTTECLTKEQKQQMEQQIIGFQKRALLRFLHHDMARANSGEADDDDMPQGATR